MDFDRMNAIQRRLHNAACVLGADGDEYGFEQLQRDAIAEIERLRAALTEYANPLNWDEYGAGIRRVWLEPGSTTPAQYNGFEAARAALGPN